MRIVWVYGPPGVGKSVTAWKVLNALSEVDGATAYVDIDQLGMSFPEPSDDPGRHRIKGRALAAVAKQYAGFGASTLVVSGVLDPNLMSFYRGELTSFQPAFVRLTVDDVELKRRMDARGVAAEDWAEVLAKARALQNARVDHPVVLADGANPAEVARRVLAAADGIRSAASSRDHEEPGNPALTKASPSPRDPGEAILLGGAEAVGKSTIAWEAFMSALRDGIPAAFVDLRQLGFLGPDGGQVNHPLQAASVGALWRVFQAGGARLLLLNGAVDEPEQVERYRTSLGSTPLTCYLLTANEQALVGRVRARTRGEGAHLAGDHLVGRSEDDAQEVVAQALLAQERALAVSTLPVIDTTDLTARDAAHRILIQHAATG